ncbi:SEL1-like repeat protein [Streptomyces lomondensis]|uniref:Tetratricopeptide repeat protein n=1 Tax=Streptomyces lomondensis TaxID=68229 RepID=A0ABQ2X8H2_9ACTN|nr:tetratricopeptide repeat protein [Streptomyces lomondensis]MCF0082422.1 tetratricopeptide repeat protein [Streptomyces lomondensis]GGX04265.1 hypothetical protein GCM10010383_37650 [Streptomyces lomondensis]
MGRTPDFFENLRRVGVLKRSRLGGRPSDYALSKVVRPSVSRDTVGAWLRGERFPQQPQQLLTVLAHIRAAAAAEGLLRRRADDASGESVADLLDEGRWQDMWGTEQRRRTEAKRESVQRQQAYQALTAEERAKRQAALADCPRPVRSWTAQRLGVHPAIPGDPVDPDGAGFVLPAYVSRPHDDRLRRQLSAGVAEDATPLLVVVRGESCTGKTRTAFEALNATVPDDFHLLFPTDTDSLLAALDADALEPRTVLWLNEAQNYLTGPSGEAAAAALLRRLDADGPFIVVATLWPVHDQTLTAVPAPGTPDPHRQARKLLDQAHYVYLPASFADDLDAVCREAGRDRSLSAALDAGGAELTQTLAAGPDLVTHYEHPADPHGVYGSALISAAMDAHRLGVTGPLPLDFLREAAPGYLTDRARAGADPDWYTAALACARTLIKQVARPLQDVPRPSGMGALPGVVRLADYLQQHGHQSRWTLYPPASFWSAAARHLTLSADLVALAHSAYRRFRYRHAALLYRTAADLGHPEGPPHLARMQERAGDREEAERLARRAADAGHPDALWMLARMRHAAGDLRDAERLYRAAADVGHADALPEVAHLRVRAGDREEAERLYREAAEAGHRVAMSILAAIRERAGDREEAERLARQAADAGDPEVLRRVAWMREKAGERQEAERLYRAGVDAGFSDAVEDLARMREKAGDRQEAERLAHGNPDALGLLAQMRERAGDRQEAERLARRAADAGSTSALWVIARMRERDGDPAEAERLYRANAEARAPRAQWELARMREAAGDTEEAERLYREIAEPGNPEATDALTQLARMREAAGDTEEAERLYRQVVRPGNPAVTDVLMRLARIRETAGDTEEAERLRHQAINAGKLTDAFQGMYVVARHGSFQAFLRYGIETDGTLAEPWAWPPPRPREL